MSRAHHNSPLGSIGQGDFRRDLYPEDLGMTAAADTLDLRFLIREPAERRAGDKFDRVVAYRLGEKPAVEPRWTEDIPF